MKPLIRKSLLYVVSCLFVFCFFPNGRFLSTELVQAALPDPGTKGRLAVTAKEYKGPDIFLPQFPGPVEQLAVVWHPSRMGNTAYPLIIFLHGRHVTCYNGTTTKLQYPYPAGYQPIPNYRGYDYLAQSLASHGFIVVSISANGINAKDSPSIVEDCGALARAQLVQRHLDIWRQFNNGGDPWGGIFRGRVNLNKVGTMGHSRGGEGVVKHFLLNASSGSPYGIKAVFPMAPTNFGRYVINKVPLGILLPYCDGDVSDLQGIHYYDDARYSIANDSAPKHTFLVLGANHNFYNTTWTPGLFTSGALDDWIDSSPCPGCANRGTTDPHCGVFNSGKRLTAAQQRSTALAYIQAFFRCYVGSETKFLPYLTNDALPPKSAQTQSIHVSYHPEANQRLSINRLLENKDLTLNNLGGSVSQNGLSLYRLCGGSYPQLSRCLTAYQDLGREPHVAPSSHKGGLSQLQFSWVSSNACFVNQIPPQRGNLSSFNRVQFRAGVDFTSANNRSPVQDLSLMLIDSIGRRASVPVSHYSRALFFPPGRLYQVPKVTLNTVRIPLSVFRRVDLRNIRTVRFDFNKQNSGTLMISDLMFSR